MTVFCKYKHIFGEPNTGLRKTWRVFGISLIDLLPTLIVVYLLWKYTSLNWWQSLVLVFVLMVVAHHLFCVRTTTDRWLFPDKE